MKACIPLLSCLLLAGCGSDNGADGATPEPVALVRTAPAESGTSSDEVTIFGATEASPGSIQALVVPAEAIVARVVSPTGTAVSSGQEIATLKASPATRLEIAKAASDVAAAQAAYQRAVRLRADGLASDADVETARAAAQTASATRANLGLAGNGLALRAPITGTVQALTARPGDQLAAGTVLATIAAPGDLRARFGVDPALAQRIRPGQEIRIEPVGGGASVAASVVGVDMQVDPATRLAGLFVRLPKGLAPAAGVPLRATLSAGAATTGITIPYAALLDDGGRSYVFVVQGGIAKARDVLPGSSAGDRIRILKGLQAGERVVTEGGTALEDDMKVREGSPK
ncbi:RND family efflux transporter MFP subunit [Novosphingobium sp. PhB165]|uniref:efflux RND transporter periplasmic adaptor subunit n=1 Tax=Novosphingobium sp. PhB165 TaxID=2485105 RepID=UPI0010E17D8F|nr:efflux RND transporter periplasmic adaptor subunit [Novosphingobium sp. PhB165]TCM20650.1 RND family efflux transporter MFP subunit [Novosphingobium sp. PhB165]